MKTSTDIRDATFERLRHELAGLRREVYHAWVVHGPGTTRQISERAGIDLLNIRPRTTELIILGLVRASATAGPSGEGCYEATPREDWLHWHTSQLGGQLQMPI